MSESGRLAAVRCDRVLIVDDHRVLAESLQRALECESDFEVVGRAGNVADAVELARGLHPSLVVMDYLLPDGSGAEAIREIRRTHPDIVSVVLTGAPTPHRLSDALDAGCAGFVGKDQSFAEVLGALRAPRSGDLVVPPGLAADAFQHLARQCPRPALSPREREVLDRLAAGESTDRIAESLFLSIYTVRNHIRNALRKLGARTRLEGVVVAGRHGLITPHRSASTIKRGTSASGLRH